MTSEDDANADLVILEPDHPGFRDPTYRSRRNEIARLALEYRGGPVPAVDYTQEEHHLWRRVWDRLRGLHRSLACSEYLGASDALALDRTRIPQLAQLSPRLETTTGFRMLPVAGLVSARTFLSRLGQGVFLATQYVRHPSAPFYTPEPDVIHELIGHASTLAHSEIANLSRALGQVAAAADPASLSALERVYWYSLEFGLVEEQGRIKALGAGLLSSAGELERLTGAAQLLPWDLGRMTETPYDPTGYQPELFVAPSFRRLVTDVSAWAAQLRVSGPARE